MKSILPNLFNIYNITSKSINDVYNYFQTNVYQYNWFTKRYAE